MKLFKKTEEKTDEELKSEIKFSFAWSIFILVFAFCASLYMIIVFNNLEVALSVIALSFTIVLSHALDIQKNQFELRIREAVKNDY
jgi:hypothetical protein